MTLFGIPVTVSPSFFLMAAFLAYGRLDTPKLAAVWLIVVFVGVLVHELGHALVGRGFGLAPRIELYSFGGLTSWDGGRQLTPPREIAVSLAGSFFGFGLGALVLAIRWAFPGADDSQILRTAMDDALRVTFGWGLLNLLPVLPLDGGNTLRSLLSWLTGRPLDRFVQATSLVVAGAACLVALRYGQPFAALLGGWLAVINGQALYEGMKTEGDGDLLERLAAGWRAVEANEGDAAVRAAEHVLAKARSNAVKREAAELRVYGYLRAGDPEAALKAYGFLSSVFEANPYLEALTRLETGDGASAARILGPLYERSGHPEAARLLGRALVKDGRTGEAFEIAGRPEASAGVVASGIFAETFAAGAFEDAARAASIAFDRSGDPARAYDAACALARASRPEEALEWLRRAVDSGFRDERTMATDSDLDSLRGLPEFERIHASIG